MTLLAFFVGTAHFEATSCSGANAGGECDIAPLEGFVWAIGALVLMFVATVGHAIRRRVRGEPTR